MECGPMRGLAAYVLAGILTALALDFVAPPVGLGMAVGAPPARVRPTQLSTARTKVTA